MKVFEIVYSDGDVTDWYVAADEADAKRRFADQMNAMGYGPDDEEARIVTIREERYEKRLTMHCDTEPREETCWQWCQEMPDGGMLGSTEW